MTGPPDPSRGGAVPPPEPVPSPWDLLPPELDLVCDAAVDPLEIAAALEAAGVSNRVVQTTYGRHDLFALAQELYDSRPRRSVPLDEEGAAPRYGGVEDLARGLLFVVPAISLAVAARALHLVLPWWAFPVALSIGWAFGQATARSAVCLRNRGRTPGVVVVPSLLVTGATGLGAALIGVTVGHGGTSAVVTVTVFCAYVASLTVLSVYEEPWPMALSLAPAMLCSAAYLVDPSNRTLRVADVVAVAVTVAVSLLLALRHAVRGWWSPSELGSFEQRSVLTFFGYGAGCGVAVSAVSLSAHGAESLGPLSLVALPVMLSLGVLEWQLHSFRARAAVALDSSGSLDAFRRRAAGNLLRSTACYLAALVGVSLLVVTVRLGGGHRVPVLSLGSEDALGVTLFVGMVVSMCSALHLGVRSWLAGAAAFAVALVGVHWLGFGADRVALHVATLVGAGVAMLVISVGAVGVVRVPFHFRS